MKNMYTLALSLLILACAGKTDKITPENIGKKLDIKHQSLEIELDWQEKAIKGKTTILFSSFVETIKVKLDAAELLIDSVLHEGKLLDFQMDTVNEKVHIQLGNRAQANEEIELEITFRTTHKNESDPNNIWGSFGKGVRFFEPSLTEKERRFQVWTVSEPESSKYWYPTNDDLSDVRTTEVIIHVEKPLMALSNGILVSSADGDGSKRTFHWKTLIPNPPHQTFLVIGEYDNYGQSFGNIVLNNYGYPDEREGTKESVVRLPDMMGFFSEYTGQVYPYPEYTQIFVQDFGGWKGAQGNSIITENMIDDKTTHEDFLYGWDLTEGEALAHQWFGSYLKPKSWKDAWLTKGFARYFSGLYNQYKNGNTEFLTYQLSPDLNAYLSDWKSGTNTIIAPDLIKNTEKFINGNTPYAKGALVLHMLRKELGEAKWKEGVETYVSRFGGKMVATEDFVKVVNEVNGKSMDWFFEQWVFGVGHPKFRVEEQYDTIEKKLVIDVFQDQKIDSVVNGKKIPYFQGKMLVEIDDRFEEIQIESQKKNSFVFISDQKPELINLDVEDTWIKEVAFEKTTAQLLAELALSNDVLHRRLIMQKLTTTAVDKNVDENTRLNIEAALRNSALTEDYWRMRLIALWQLQSMYSSRFVSQPLKLNKETEQMLLTLNKREKSWVKAWATNFLGTTKDKKYVPRYLDGLKDYSDRVVFMSAIALGKTKDSRAYEALKNLPSKPSWKNQSLISALHGFKELEDPRAYGLALQSLTDSDNPHWNLGVPIWDHRIAAAHTLVALGKVDEAYDKIYIQFQDALKTGNINDMFYNAQLVSVLANPKGIEVFEQLKAYFKNDKDAIRAIAQLRKNFENSL
ncbi:M1 family aminopeptidase [Maribacter aestuarii]|uniref:M1 family aminopeptidase n=1 Tax=Maribacter aestuarii TaxID=1130723 RepID=UPI00248C44CE|nr:M1 family aminopeptidase [Maribacter aestuarii]